MQKPAPELEEGLLILDHLATWGPLTTNLQGERLAELQNLLVGQIPDISHHFASVASHRRWLRAVMELWKLVSPENRARKEGLKYVLEHRVREHDLSKFTPNEALGYHFKWFAFNSTLLTEGEKEALWQAALQSHYGSNDHHPQFWAVNPIPVGKLKQQPTMTSTALLESVLDMLACRLERELVPGGGAKTMMHPKELMAIPQSFLERFPPEERRQVNQYLVDWAEALNTEVSECLIANLSLDAWQSRYGIYFLDDDEDEEEVEAHWRGDYEALKIAAVVVVEDLVEDVDLDPWLIEASRLGDPLLSAQEIDLIEPEDLLFGDEDEDEVSALCPDCADKVTDWLLSSGETTTTTTTTEVVDHDDDDEDVARLISDAAVKLTTEEHMSTRTEHFKQ